ncbi:MAG: RsmE family RNA methyltransferase [Bacteroidota bacterium]|nr:RsmE family RNA methyltransferase [Bacteroidota bacterium]
MIAFYTPECDELKEGEIITLNAEESWHGAKVLRIKNDESIIVLNGKGWIGEGRIQTVHDKQTAVILDKVLYHHPATNSLSIAVSVLKTNERMEWMLEKLTELGVAKISFIECKRTERNKLNLERMQKIAIAALKQCKRSWLPVIEGVMSYEKYMQQEFVGEKYIAFCDAKEYIKFNAQKSATILIGPEGDFNESEIVLAKAQGFKPILISKQILRTETAAMAIAAVWDLGN